MLEEQLLTSVLAASRPAAATPSVRGLVCGDLLAWRAFDRPASEHLPSCMSVWGSRSYIGSGILGRGGYPALPG